MAYRQAGYFDFSLKKIHIKTHIMRFMGLLQDGIQRFRPAAWLIWSAVLVAGLAGCSTTTPPAGGDLAPKADSLSALSVDILFQQQLGVHWYKIKEDDLRVGWGRIEKSEHYRFPSMGKCYRIDIDMERTLLINGYTHRVVNSLRMEFETKPPFRLLRFKAQEEINDHRSSNEIVRAGDKFQLRVENGGNAVAKDISDVSYQLKDAMAIELWLGKSPAVGDFIYMAYIDPDTLERSAGSVKIVSIDTNNDAERRYHITHARMGPGVTDAVFNENLTLESCRFDRGFEMQLATEGEARSPIPSQDLYIHYMLPIETTIGRKDEVTRLELTIDTFTGELLGNAPGQEVRPVPDDKHYRIVLDPTGGFREAASDREIKEALEVPEALTRDGAVLLQTARRQLDGVRDPHLLVERLMAFVDETIADSNEMLSPNLSYALKKLKGDCSEHAAVFEALARAFKIPCRRVGGLVYMGDWSQSFGLHAWNEVAIDGYWQPIDVTRQSSALPPFYIRFPLNPDKQDLLTHHIARMELSVFDVRKRSSPWWKP